MTFKRFFEQLPEIPAACAELEQNQALLFEKKDNKLCYLYDLSRVSKPVSKFMRRIAGQTSMIIETYLFAKVFGYGPKIFEVGQLDFESMMHTDVNIPMSSYVQPFETIIIQFPEAFCKNRIVSCGGLKHLPDFHEPSFGVLHHDSKNGIVLFGLFFSSMSSIKTGFCLEPDSCIETTLTEIMKTPYHDSLPTSNSESELFIECFKGCMNYCLLLDEVGFKQKVTADHIVASWKRQLQSKNPTVVKQAEHRLLTNPNYYGITQNVKLFSSTSTEPGDGAGSKKSPHHRRGYYRLQHHGPNNSLTKRVRIPPVFVNKHLFLGNLSSTSVTYS